MREYRIDYTTMKEKERKMPGQKWPGYSSTWADVKRYCMWSVDAEDQDDDTPAYRRMPGFVAAVYLKETPAAWTKILIGEQMWTVVNVVISFDYYDGKPQWNLEVTKKDKNNLETI